MASRFANIRALVDDAQDKEAKGQIDLAINSMNSAIDDLQIYCDNEKDIRARNGIIEKLRAYDAFRDKLRKKLGSHETPSNTSFSTDEFVPAMSTVKWDDIIGLENVKEDLKTLLVYKQKFPSALDSIANYRSILLYGPPGTGKTLLASAICTEIKANFYSITAGNILSRWQGDSEKAIRSLFTAARAKTPSVIFMDEVDGLLSKRDSSSDTSMRTVKNEFLTQVSIPCEGMCLLVGATNTPWDIDDAMIRRFEKRVYIPLPSLSDRLRLFTKLLPALHITEEEMDKLGFMSEGYSSSDIATVAKEVSVMPFNRAKTATQFTLCDDGKYMACEADGIPMTLSEVPDDQLKLGDILLSDVIACLSKIRSSVQLSADNVYTRWQKSHGTDN
jgi:vacuolar protein-sorting-associated protein 4